MTKLAVFFIVALFLAWVYQVSFPGAALLGLGAMLGVLWLLFLFSRQQTPPGRGGGLPQ